MGEVQCSFNCYPQKLIVYVPAIICCTSLEHSANTIVVLKACPPVLGSGRPVLEHRQEKDGPVVATLFLSSPVLSALRSMYPILKIDLD